jgi:hypothetical protein
MEESHNNDTTSASPPTLVHRDDGTSSFDAKEKKNGGGLDSVEIADEKLDPCTQALDEDETPVYRNGEPVITTGRDVSRFAVDARDDGDEALTFRSIFLGSMFAGMGAALSQASMACPRLLTTFRRCFYLLFHVRGQHGEFSLFGAWKG